MLLNPWYCSVTLFRNPVSSAHWVCSQLQYFLTRAEIEHRRLIKHFRFYINFIWLVPKNSLLITVRSHRTNRLPLDRFSLNLIFEDFFENQSRKFKFDYILTSIKSAWYEDLCTFMIVSQLFLEWEIFQKGCRENQSIFYFQ